MGDIYEVRHSNGQSQSQSHMTTDGQSVSKSWCRAPSGAHESYSFHFCGAPSLTRGRFCLLYVQLALTSAVFLGSESLGSRDRILLSQISTSFFFVASYDSQGHSGGIRPRLHMGIFKWA
jgi:hypothetical protein